MANGNEVTLIGNVTREPEIRFTKSGTALAKFGLAHNERRFNKESNDWDEQVHFFDIACWKSLAENVGKSISKGDRIVVVGRLDHQTWESEEGDKRSKVEIVANEVSPSLMWAEVTISKNERSDGTTSSRPSKPVKGDSFDEEPF